MKNKKAILGYIPVLHQGYMDFFKKHSEPGDTIFIIHGQTLAQEIPILEYLTRDLRAIYPYLIERWLRDYYFDDLASKGLAVVGSIAEIKKSSEKYDKIIMPDDDVTAAILELVPELKHKVTLEKMFLRWDKNASLLEKEVNVPVIGERDLPTNVVAELRLKIGESVDWWRNVATVIYDDEGNIIIAAYNRHFPNDLALNIFGDPRFNFKPGEHIENCTAIHSEAWAIAQAAKKGIKLEGLNMLVSDFPCPVCAKSVAEIGIKKLFFVRGYSKIDGQKTLEDAGIELQKVVFEK